MKAAHLIVAALAAGFLVAATPHAAHSQFGALKKKAEEAKKKLDEATKKSTPDTAQTKTADTGGTPASASSTTPAPKASARIWENYDFVPGNRVIFYTDFSEDKVGNFARGLKYRSGPVEVVERDGVKVLRSTGQSEFLIPVGRKLPQRFTLEIDVIASDPDTHGVVAFEGGPEFTRGDNSAEVSWELTAAFMAGSGQNVSASAVNLPEETLPELQGHVAHIRVLMDSAYFKMYTNERRIYNIPELAFVRDSVIRVRLTATEDAPVFITGIRVAESETEVLYDALAAKGRWATQGILFATGKADVQPESRPVLKEIASMLKHHGEMKILIEGHTDNVGAAASNLTLSDARAAAVKAVLVAEHGADGTRIRTKGFGDTKPAVPNTTAAGRAQNRRVEIVKQ
jgi:outer membrane protein OmpA-like peptidoglycan-associated protein